MKNRITDIKSSLQKQLAIFCAQMERAIQNVLVNAIRYSSKGEVIYKSLSNGKNTVYCEIENTGVHIPEDRIPHLFEAFYRADTSRNRNTGELD